jgi:superfamily I DNA/RNA helicase
MVGGTSYFSLDSGRVAGEKPVAARSFADFAVLYRLSAQSRPLIEAFDRSGIPYQTIGQTPPVAHKAVREVLAYLWLLHNPRSRLHLATVLATMLGIGWGEASLLLFGITAGIPSDEKFGVASNIARDASPLLTAAQRARLTSLVAFYRELVQEPALPVARQIERIQQFIAEGRGEPFSDADAQRLHQLVLRAVPFEGRLADFLESTALQTETDAYDPRADRVTLMTLHAAKGLEFPAVRGGIVAVCAEGCGSVGCLRPAQSKIPVKGRGDRPRRCDRHRGGAAAILRRHDPG